MSSQFNTKISALSNRSRVEDMHKARAEMREKINKFKRKAWLDFCKFVMTEDSRYTLMSITDYNNKMGNSQTINRVQSAEGVFSNFCLTRTGELADVYLLPCEPTMGISIDVGSKYNSGTLQSFPSKAMVWPVIRIADELERQFVREISIESKKHTGGTNATCSSSSNSNSDTNQLSANS